MLMRASDEYVINSIVGLFSVSDWGLVGYSVFQEDTRALLTELCFK
jgi:hypothetical protein